MKAIVAVDRNWGIGKNNSLLFSLPEDMKFFRETTRGKVVVMGANTLKSFPNGAPLKNRINVVLTSGGEKEGCITVSSLTELSEKLADYPAEDVYIIGGARFYSTMLPYCSEALVTKVDAEAEADAFFDNLDVKPEWSLLKESPAVETGGHKIKFTVYRNSKALPFSR